MGAQMTTLKTRARRAGMLYVLMSVAGVPALLYLPRFIVVGDAAATARNIVTGAQLYRLLLFGDLMGSVLFVVLGLALYHLFEVVDRKQATLLMLLVTASAVLSLVEVALWSAPLVFLSGAGFLSAFTPPQLDALSLGFLQVRNFELHINETLWGLWLVPFGILIIKSKLIPKLIGVLLLMAAVGWIALSFAYIVRPEHAETISRIGGALSQCELSVILWLVIMGTKSQPADTAQAVPVS
jgi:hypothetical protein